MNAGRTGKLDALAKCTLLETLNLSGCNGKDSLGNKVGEGLTGTWHRSLTAETIISTTDTHTDPKILLRPPAPLPRFVGPARQVHQARDAQLKVLRGPYGYVVGRRSRKRLQLHLMAETITNLNPLTPLPILRLFRPAGRLDALANCTALTDLNLRNCWRLEGQSYARSASPFFTCTANRRGHQCKFTDTFGPFAQCSSQGRLNHSPNALLS